MAEVGCPRCGTVHEVEEVAVETRTPGVTDDWETWHRRVCEGCGDPFLYRIRGT